MSNSAPSEIDASTAIQKPSTESPVRVGGPPIPSRRVQWPAELSRHTSVTMNSTPLPAKTLQDIGGRDELTAALEQEHSRRNSMAQNQSTRPTFHLEPIPPSSSSNPFDYTPSQPISRADSSDDGGVMNEKLALVREAIPVFVDQGETDGLPSIRKAGVEINGGEREAKKAWQLVKAMKSGTNGFMRLRKNAGFQSGQGLGVVSPTGIHHGNSSGITGVEDGDEPSQKEGGFFSNLLNQRDLNVSGEPESMGFSSGSVSGTGVLSALMALQQEQQGGGGDIPSGFTSVATTPGSSIAPSRRTSTAGSSDEDDDEEEEERRKFTMKQREKRANKNAWHGAADVGKSMAGGVIGGGKTVAGGVIGGAGYAMSGALGGAGYVLGGGVHAVEGVTHALGFGHRRSRSVEPPLTPSTSTTRPPLISRRSSPYGSHSEIPPQIGTPGGGNEGMLSTRGRKRGIFGETVHQAKKLGDRLGLEIDSTMLRPKAAKSGAGVFGGLMLSTGNLAGVAAPAATTLAPSATRPGYHLSRYSVPEPRRKSRDTSRPTSRPTSMFHSSPSHPSSAIQSPTEEKKIETYNEKEEEGEEKDDDADATSSTTAHSTRSTPPSSKEATFPSSSIVISPPTAVRSTTSPSMISSKPKSVLNLHLGDLSYIPKFGFHNHSRPASIDSPRLKGGSTGNLVDYFAGHKETQEERESREWEKEKRRRRKAKEKRHQNEVFITRHVAAILARQDFIMKMARSFMMFGAPSHRLEAQMQATARVLEINCQVIYLPGVMLCSFGDTATHTSEIKFLKQANGLDLGKLLAAYYVYYKVIHDQISVTDASLELDDLMIAPPKYKLWQNLIIGGLASAFIQPSAFYGSFIDCLASIPLGALLVLVQVVASKNDLYSSLFEIVIAAVNAFLAAALASTGQFCFSSVASGAVVLILPGYIVLCGSLELANRSIISGSVRLVYALLYALFLGFGLAIGSEVYERVTNATIAGSTDFTCAALRVDAPWWRATITPWLYFITIPMFLLMLGLRNGQPLFRKETIIMLFIGMCGFAANYFSGKAFVNRADISSAMGSFMVGFLGNMYGKFTTGSPFVVMVVGVLVQLPSGLSNGGGLLQFATQSITAGTSSYSVGFSAAESLIEVSIGLTVGLFVSAALVNLLGGGRRRGSNLSSF